MTTEAQMREQFEDALRAKLDFPTEAYTRNENGSYCDWDIEMAFDGFRVAHQSATEQMKPLVEALRKSQDILSRAKALYDISSCGNSGWNEALCERITLNGQALATIKQGWK